MKSIKILAHPILLISAFLLLVIEGEEFGGIYFLYLILSTPYGAPYALVGISSIVMVLFSLAIDRHRRPVLRSATGCIGVLLMLLSLILFFSNGNKVQTFYEPIPLLSFVLFIVMVSCFLIYNTGFLIKGGDDNLKDINILV